MFGIAGQISGRYRQGGLAVSPLQKFVLRDQNRARQHIAESRKRRGPTTPNPTAIGMRRRKLVANARMPKITSTPVARMFTDGSGDPVGQRGMCDFIARSFPPL